MYKRNNRLSGCKIGIIGFDDRTGGNVGSVVNMTESNANTYIDSISGGRSIEQALTTASNSFLDANDNRIQAILIVTDGFGTSDKTAMLNRSREILENLQNVKMVYTLRLLYSGFDSSKDLFGTSIVPIWSSETDLTGLSDWITSIAITLIGDEVRNVILEGVSNVMQLPNEKGIYIMLDDELIHGATLQIEYTIGIDSTR